MLNNEQPLLGLSDAAAGAGIPLERLKQFRRFYAAQIFQRDADDEAGEDDRGQRWRFSVLDLLVLQAMQRMSDFGIATSEAAEFSAAFRTKFRALAVNPSGEENHLLMFARRPNGTPLQVPLSKDADLMGLLGIFQKHGLVLIVDCDAIIDDVKRRLMGLGK